jgi:hypothetical protein
MFAEESAESTVLFCSAASAESSSAKESSARTECGWMISAHIRLRQMKPLLHVAMMGYLFENFAFEFH